MTVGKLDAERLCLYTKHHNCVYAVISLYPRLCYASAVCVGRGENPPLVMMSSDPVIVRGVTHPSVMGCDEEHPQL